jgi:hypothetical protein
VRFKVFTALKISVMFFWVQSPCGLVGTMLKMETARSSEMMAPTHRSTRRCNPKERNLNPEVVQSVIKTKPCGQGHDLTTLASFSSVITRKLAENKDLQFQTSENVCRNVANKLLNLYGPLASLHEICQVNTKTG